MAVRASDLPPEVRRRLGLDQPDRPRKSRRGVGDGVPCPGRCVTCGRRFRTAAAWQRHATAHSPSARWEIDL